MTVVDREKVTDALVALLRAGTQKPVGDNEIPRSGGYPYVVVRNIAGGGYWGPSLSAPEQNADFVYQVDSVGRDRRNAEWMADTVRRSILSRTVQGGFQVQLVDPLGWKVADRGTETPGGVEVSGETSRATQVFTISESFVLRVVPA